MARLYKPGEKPKRIGIFIETGPEGKDLLSGRQVRIVEEDRPLPPTRKKGFRWKVVSKGTAARAEAVRSARGGLVAGPKRPLDLPPEAPSRPKPRKKKKRGRAASKDSKKKEL